MTTLQFDHVCGGPHLWSSIWEAQFSGTTAFLYGLSFTDANNGTVVGEKGTILRTTDGGATWKAQSSGTTGNLYGVSFTNANTEQRWGARS